MCSGTSYKRQVAILVRGGIVAASIWLVMGPPLQEWWESYLPSVATTIQAEAQSLRPLLSGRVEDYGTSKKKCSLEKGILTMLIETRDGDYAMCCVRQNEPIAVKVGDEISAQVKLEEEEEEFHVKVENADRQPVFLHALRLGKGENPLKLRLDKQFVVSRFCIAAMHDGRRGKPQTVTVNSATISPPSFPKKP